MSAQSDVNDAARAVLASRHDDLDTGSSNWVAVLDCHLETLKAALAALDAERVEWHEDPEDPSIHVAVLPDGRELRAVCGYWVIWNKAGKGARIVKDGIAPDLDSAKRAAESAARGG